MELFFLADSFVLCVKIVLIDGEFELIDVVKWLSVSDVID
jgi:hypothetical protein